MGSFDMLNGSLKSFARLKHGRKSSTQDLDKKKTVKGKNKREN